MREEIKKRRLLEGLRGDILVLLRGPRHFPSATAITKKIGCTYAYGTMILVELEEQGYLESKLTGRRRAIYLTDKGMSAADAISQYRQVIGELQ